MCFWPKHALQSKKLFPDCTNFTNQWKLQQSQLPTCAISCASCGLPALFLEEKAVVGSKETWILSPPWHSSSLPPACCCPICFGVCPLGEGPFPAYTEIKTTVLGEISDCCFNISIFSGHEPVYKVQFLIMSRFFSESKTSRA